MGIASDLRESVLQAAIQGKLTEQLATDGNARDLLKQIKAEKDKLIADKKIKKEKALAPISDDEKPFEIPDNWEWCYLQNIVNIRSAVRVHQADWRKSGVPFYRAREIVKLSKQGYVDNELFIDRTKYEEYKKSSGVSIKGDLMVSGVGTLGASYVVKDTDEFYYKDASVLCFENRFGINPYYLQKLLATPFMMSQIYSSDAYGTTVATLTMDRAYGFLVPLPPLPEQERIVAKVDELMKEIDELEKIENELESIKKAFPDDMKSALLQAAMKGELTERLATDGNVRDLLKQIKTEKDKLIADKKIKKEKALTPISDDEKPFEIPDNWEWVRLGTVCDIINGFTPLKSNDEFWKNGTIPWFTIDDVHSQGRYIYKTAQHITDKALSKDSKRIVPPNTVLLCCTASVGEWAYTKIALTTNQQFNALVIKDEYKNVLHSLYLLEFVKTLKTKLITKSGKTTFNFLSVGKLADFVIPLPPLPEQERIVAQLDKLLPLCESLS